MDWDPSREYDSQTFSEDYNLHGASGRSFDHPSVTRDDQFLRGVLNNLNKDDREGGEEGEEEGGEADAGDTSSIDDADLDLIVDIVDGKTPVHGQPPSRLQQRPLVHQPDENSVNSIMQYLLDGSQDQEEFQDSPHFDPSRQYYPAGAGLGSSHRLSDQQSIAMTEHLYENNFTERSGSTPKRQMRGMLDVRNTPKGSPMTGRRTTPMRQQHSEQISRLPMRNRSVSIDESSKPRPTGIPLRSGAGGLSSAAMSPMRAPQQPEKPPGQRIANFADLPKPAFRSAMKAPKNYSDSQSNEQQSTKSKLSRHIQLPSETLNEKEDEGQESWEPVVHPQDPGQEETEAAVEKSADEIPAHTEVDTERAAPVTTVSGPSRFTRISKKNVSPAKKAVTIIPTPQDEQEEEQKVRQTVKAFKKMLNQLGLPLTSTLESSLNSLTDAIVEEGGLCEMIGLAQKLGGMYEKQTEVFHQMTDQLLAGETGGSNHDKEESESKIAELTQQLQETKAELEESKKEAQFMRDKEQLSILELMELRSKVELAKSQSSTKAETNTGAIPISPKWQDHVAKIEEELQALKTTLGSISLSSGGATYQDQEGMEERMIEIVQENRRLKMNNRRLAQQVLDMAKDDTAIDDSAGVIAEHKTILRNIMNRVGVNRQSDILPALGEIELVVQDLPVLRKFVAKVERVIWEPEIMEGLVRVQRVQSAGNIIKENKAGKEMDDLEPVIPAGRTCSQPLEGTLQRLREWSELLDVLNHVEFADELDDNITVVPS
ncbi:hypothetical protein EMPS_11177 [Entomortierella parvispora]|uniref:Uncharacterized protein n=1 Tax=Entomortierella parvispora TaxID=205924 RepID=A0A9P3M1Z6_9FUNG|nr:hypothetical protein EMPS_11177 [Entomortierella parvispora]